MSTHYSCIPEEIWRTMSAGEQHKLSHTHLISFELCHKKTFFLHLQTTKVQMSRVVRKPAFCICENKDADQLRGNREADQRLCFRYSNV